MLILGNTGRDRRPATEWHDDIILCYDGCNIDDPAKEITVGEIGLNNENVSLDNRFESRTRPGCVVMFEAA